jgi:RimJ/RimL family protein N-acetyltransferase
MPVGSICDTPAMDAPGLRGLVVDSLVELSIPQDGIVFGGLLLRLPSLADVDQLAPAFAAAELREDLDLPSLTRDDLAEAIPHLKALVVSGRLAPLVVVDIESGDVLGGGTFHHLDSERRIIEIGFWLYPQARGHGVATKTARALAQHAFDLGVRRVVAQVNVGNRASERVLERAGFTREGISRWISMTVGGRVDKTVWSLLPGE